MQKGATGPFLHHITMARPPGKESFGFEGLKMQDREAVSRPFRVKVVKMKNAVLFLAAILILTASPAFAVIVGSAHDFSTQGWSGGKICKPCHTPHNANNTVADAPLWNHEVTTATFTLYSSTTLDATMGQPDGFSKLCLSCHDGTVALDSYGGATGTNFMLGNANLGTDLSDDHPVSFDWTHEPIGGSCSQCHDFHGSSGTTFVSPLPFFDGRVECATCHDPHNNAPEVKMLRMTLAGSSLCLHCHSNK